jgi:hypothetical protein
MTEGENRDDVTVDQPGPFAAGTRNHLRVATERLAALFVEVRGNVDHLLWS